VQALTALALLAWRLPHLRTEAHLGSPVSKESAFLVNNLLFVGAAVVVFWGTILPLVSEAITGDQRAVGPPFFNRVLAPLGAALLLLATIGTVVPWRRGSTRRVAKRLAWPVAVASALAGVALVATKRPAFAGLFWICVLLATTSVLEIVRAARAYSHVAVESPARRSRLPFARNPRRYGGYVVHLGVAIMVVGFAGSIGRVQTEVVVEPGGRFEFAGSTFVFDRLDRFDAPDKEVNLAVVHLLRDGDRYATMRPQLNFHRNWEQPQSEIAIRSTPAADIYLILAGVGDDGASVFRVHRNPLVFWVWTGAVVALIGGLIALVVGRRVATPALQGARELQEAT
jgi:cytochrome c-type biogenesis protein CcmF